MTRRTTFPGPVRVGTLASCLLLLAACGGSLPPPPPPVQVSVDQGIHDVSPGTTFGDLIDEFQLRADNGRLLSISGAVLERFADPGRILLNGSRAPVGTRLTTGDRVNVVNGEDRTEGTRRVVTDVGRRVGNPERTLAVYRTKEITVSGRVSGEILSVTDVPLGHGTAPRAVALTFDDGPWPVHTERVLAVLHRYHVPATFFMVGIQVERYPELVRKVHAKGLPIGNHSFDHPVSPPFSQLPRSKISSEIVDANDQLRHDGVIPTLFRPPGGSYDDFVVQEARRAGMRTVLWSVDPQDWRSNLTAKEVAQRVLSHVKAGSIVLLHDGGGDAGHTIKALPAIVKGIRKRGLHFVTVPAAPA